MDLLPIIKRNKLKILFIIFFVSISFIKFWVKSDHFVIENANETFIKNHILLEIDNENIIRFVKPKHKENNILIFHEKRYNIFFIRLGEEYYYINNDEEKIYGETIEIK